PAETHRLLVWRLSIPVREARAPGFCLMPVYRALPFSRTVRRPRSHGWSGLVRMGSVKLVELDKVPESPPVRLPKTPATRTMGLYLTGSHPLDRFGGGGETGLTDNLEIARNLVSYVSFCGASLVVLPERLSERPGRRGLKGQAEENSTGPDQLDVVLRLLHRQGNSAWLELNLEGQGGLPGLPPPDSAEALRQGLV